MKRKGKTRGTFAASRRPNMPIAPKSPYVVSRAPLTFMSGALAMPVVGIPGSADELSQLMEKLPALCRALGMPPPAEAAGPPSESAGYYCALAIRLAIEFIPGFRNSFSPIPAPAKRGKHGKTQDDEKYALQVFDVIRRLPGVKTDREAWAVYAECLLDPNLTNPSQRAERDKIGRNLEIRMSPLVAARRQKAKAGRTQ